MLERVLESDELKLYELVWKRAVASQMADAQLLRTSIEITGTHARRPARRVLGQRQGDRVRRLPARLRRGQRRSVGRTRRAGNAAAEAHGRRPGARARPARRDSHPAASVGAKGHETVAAGALHRSVAREAARRRRHRPAVHLRADGGHDPAPRLREQAGQGAGAELHGVRGDAAAARALRRLRRHRLHRRDGRDARRDLERPEGLARLHHARSTAATASTPGSRPSSRARTSRSTTR